MTGPRTPPSDRWVSLIGTRMPAGEPEPEGAGRLEEVVDSLRSHRVAQSPVVEAPQRRTSLGFRALFAADPEELVRAAPKLDIHR